MNKRLALVVLCIFASEGMIAQVARPAPATDEPTLKMPNVLWLEKNEALVLLRERLHRVADIKEDGGIVVAQQPPPDSAVSPDSVVTITLGVPELSITASNLNPRINEKVTFTLAFDPPPANSPKVEYHFAWDDADPLTTAEPRTTRPFSKAGLHNVTAYAVINGRWTAGRTRIPIFVADPRPVTMPQLLWLEKEEAEAVLVPLKLRANFVGKDGIVLRQGPAAGSDVTPGSGVDLILGLPELTLSTPAANVTANEEVAFNLTLDPPPPDPARVTYRIQWPDSGEAASTSTDRPVMSHRFPAGNYDLFATASIHDRWTVESNGVVVHVAAPPPPPPDPIAQQMPQLLWLERNEVDARLQGLNVQTSIAGQDGVVLQQSPAAGSDVPPGSAVTLTFGVPRLSLSASSVNPRVNDEVTFKATFDPPPTVPAQFSYRFQWHDGTADTSTGESAAAHRFAAAGTYGVTAAAVINDRWTANSSELTIAVAALPAPTPEPPTPEPETIPEPPSPWPKILLIVAVLLAVAIGAALLRLKAPRPSPSGRPPAVAVRSGLGSTTSHTILNPEQVSNGLSVRLRGGLRTEVSTEGGTNA